MRSQLLNNFIITIVKWGKYYLILLWINIIRSSNLLIIPGICIILYDILNLFSNNYFNPYSIDFENPHTAIMLGIMELHDYVLFFLILILWLVLVIFFWSIIYFKLFFIISSFFLLNYQEKWIHFRLAIRDGSIFEVLGPTWLNTLVQHYLTVILPGIKIHWAVMLDKYDILWNQAFNRNIMSKWTISNYKFQNRILFKLIELIMIDFGLELLVISMEINQNNYEETFLYSEIFKLRIIKFFQYFFNYIYNILYMYNIFNKNLHLIWEYNSYKLSDIEYFMQKYFTLNKFTIDPQFWIFLNYFSIHMYATTSRIIPLYNILQKICINLFIIFVECSGLFNFRRSDNFKKDFHLISTLNLNLKFEKSIFFDNLNLGFINKFYRLSYIWITQIFYLFIIPFFYSLKFFFLFFKNIFSKNRGLTSNNNYFLKFNFLDSIENLELIVSDITYKNFIFIKFLYPFNFINNFKNSDTNKLKRYFFKNNLLNFKQISWYLNKPVVEFIWISVPVIILIFLAIPSLILIYSIDEWINPLYSVIIIGNQWYWSYEYSNICFWGLENYLYLIMSDKFGYLLHQISFMQFTQLLDNIYSRLDIHKSYIDNSLILDESSLSYGSLRLLTTDTALLLPSYTPIRLLITSSDVIHSWAVPNFGIKMDAVPGRLNQIFFLSTFCGSNWGQCSESCGVNHGFMPIEVRVVPLCIFEKYLDYNFNWIMELVIEELFNKLYSYFWKQNLFKKI